MRGCKKGYRLNSTSIIGYFVFQQQKNYSIRMIIFLATNVLVKDVFILHIILRVLYNWNPSQFETHPTSIVQQLKPIALQIFTF